MKKLKRKYLRRKILEIRNRFFSAAGIKRTDGRRFSYTLRLAGRGRALFGKNALLVKKFSKGQEPALRTLAIEGVKYLKAGGEVYKITD
jgi:hypothetical protein